jgi:hypothetical protein
MANVASNSFKSMLLKGQIAGLTDTFKMILMKNGFTFDKDTHCGYADVIANEIIAGSGYTAGGQELSGVSITKNNGDDTGILQWHFASWTASGGSIEAIGGIIFDDSTSVAGGDDYEDAIVSYIDFGGLQKATDGLIFRVYNPYIIIS